MRRFVLLLSSLLFCSAASPSSSGGRIWTITTNMRVDTVNGEPSDGSENYHDETKVCAGPIDEKVMTTLFEAGIDGAKIYNFVATNGHVSFDAAQNGLPKGGSYDFHAEGTYDEQSIRLSLRAQGMADGDHLEVNGTAIGVRTGKVDCVPQR